MDNWIGREPERFYAFLRRRSDGAFVGDVNYHASEGGGFRDMGIVIYAPERGRGYGKEGLFLLADRALRIDGVPGLRNDFETERDAAYRIHKAVGFREVGKKDGMIRLELSREEYLSACEDGKRRGQDPAQQGCERNTRARWGDEGETDDRTC